MAGKTKLSGKAVLTIEFVPDVGYRLSSSGKSMVLASLVFLKPNQMLSTGELVALGGMIDRYSDAVAGRVPLRTSSFQDASAHGTLADDVAYKFTDDDGLDFWRRGSILLRPVAEYQTIEKPGSRDGREGLGHVHLHGPSRNAHLYSMSGFNSVVICASSDARQSERSYRHGKFGRHLLKIRGAREFAEKIARKAGASRYEVRDVVYSDIKLVGASSEHVDAWVQLNGLGALREEFLDNLASNHLNELIDATAPASVFSKPRSFWRERERRFHFLMPSDVTSAFPVSGPELLEHIEVMT